ncbi:hypothetical protein [Paenarthrobacter nicotinovorans]|uniref:hypothetical protein n=1 Tax=Paenarthrobacter nicotinovorans TaxID=29320 RepID=UPI0011A0B76F|nr:hypothetical protein [Paenarthrobacter nicotinovorans]
MKHLDEAARINAEGYVFEPLILAAAMRANPSEYRRLHAAFAHLVDQATTRIAGTRLSAGRPFGPIILADGSYTVPWEWRTEAGERRVRWANIYRQRHNRPFTREQHERRLAMAARKARLLGCNVSTQNS